MAVRTTMQDLISRMRRLIADQNVTGAFPNAQGVFSDQDLQDFLDMRRIDVWYDALMPRATRLPEGVLFYYDFYAEWPDWETDAVLVDSSYNTLTPSAADFLTGHWVFPESINYLVRIQGKRYDAYFSAAEALEAWSAKVMLDFDFGVGRGDSFSRSQKFKQLQSLSASYRMKAQPRGIQMERPDMAESDIGDLQRLWYPEESHDPYDRRA